jgi:hypothetical protein
MAHKIKTPSEVLRKCFSDREWDYLTRHPDFQREWKGNCKTLDDGREIRLRDGRVLTPYNMPTIGERVDP